MPEGIAFAVDVDVWGAVLVCEVEFGFFQGGELGSGAVQEIAAFLLAVGHFVFWIGCLHRWVRAWNVHIKTIGYPGAFSCVGKFLRRDGSRTGALFRI